MQRIPPLRHRKSRPRTRLIQSRAATRPATSSLKITHTWDLHPCLLVNSISGDTDDDNFRAAGVVSHRPALSPRFVFCFLFCSSSSIRVRVSKMDIFIRQASSFCHRGQRRRRKSLKPLPSYRGQITREIDASVRTASLVPKRCSNEKNSHPSRPQLFPRPLQRSDNNERRFRSPFSQGQEQEKPSRSLFPTKVKKQK